MQNAATFWDKAAEKYARSPISDMDAYEYTLARTRSYLKATDTVLEVGAGTGSTALLLAPNVAHIHATDISSEMTRIARAKAETEGITNASFATEDTLTTGEPTYDVVLAHNLLHLVEDVDAALNAISSRLKSGGLFISKTVCEPTGGLPLKMRLMFLAIPVMQWLGKAPYVRFTPVEDWDALIASKGYKLLETGNHPVAPPSRYVVAQKL